MEAMTPASKLAIATECIICQSPFRQADFLLQQLFSMRSTAKRIKKMQLLDLAKTYRILQRVLLSLRLYRSIQKRDRCLCILVRYCHETLCRRDLMRWMLTLETRLDNVKWMQDSCNIVGEEGGYSTFKISIRVFAQIHITNWFVVNFNYAKHLFSDLYNEHLRLNGTLEKHQSCISPLVKLQWSNNFYILFEKMQKDQKPSEIKQEDKCLEASLKIGRQQSGQDHSLYNRIHSFLSDRAIKFQVMDHSPTRTSQQSANIRNTPLEWGAKTMLVKGVSGVLLLVYRANRKVSWSKLRKLEWVGKKGAMCPEQQVLALGVKPGGVPPFPQLLGVKGVIDKRFREEKMIAFNAGLQGRSIIMKTEDFPGVEIEAEFTD